MEIRWKSDGNPMEIGGNLLKQIRNAARNPLQRVSSRIHPMPGAG